MQDNSYSGLPPRGDKPFRVATWLLGSISFMLQLLVVSLNISSHAAINNKCKVRT